MCQDCDATRILYGALTAHFDDVPVLVERPIRRASLIRRRAKRLGWRTVAGQVAFSVLAVPVLRAAARRRKAVILNEHGFVPQPLPQTQLRVASMNSPEARSIIRSLPADLAVLSGTRILAPETLAAFECPVVNMHAGITPQYRGVHGGYWALADGRPDLVGTTVHFVDRGVDTGDILRQVTFQISDQDNFTTYPYLHLAAGIPALLESLDRMMEGDLAVRPSLDQDSPSQLRFHPTLTTYLRTRRDRGVR